jgi:flavoprotein hydroxylase
VSAAVETVSAAVEDPDDICPDVAIIGGGPVGLALAVLLGRHGWRIDVLERRRRPFGLPRAVHLDHEAARILQAVGVMDKLEKSAEEMDAYEWRSADGRTLLRLEPDRGPALSGWPTSTMFSQPELERLLEVTLADLPTVRLRRGCEVDGLTDEGDHVVVRSSASRTAVRARQVVACDGATSTARAALAATVRDLGYSQRWLIVDVLTDERGPWRPCNVQLCDPARPTTAVSGGRHRRRWEFLCLPGERPDELERAAFAWQLLAAWGLDPSTAKIERQALYRFDARIVDGWRHGAVSLAGDAAHQMPPFAGLGLCSGLRDAANLAWKLDLVLSDRAAPELLDTYESERSPQVREEIDVSVELGRIVAVTDPLEAAARDDAMAEAARRSGPVPIPPRPPLVAGIVSADTTDGTAGRLGLQAKVAWRAQRGRFDDIVGRGWALLSPGGDPLGGVPAELADWFRSIGGLSAAVAPGAEVDDVDGRYQGWFAELGAAVALVRPDFYLFGSVSEPSGATGLLESARSALRGNPKRPGRPDGAPEHRAGDG